MGILMILVILFFLFPIILSNTEDPIKPSNKEEVQYNLNNVVLVGHKDGVKQWMLEVNSMTDRGKKETLLNGLEHGEIYDDGDAKYFIKADGGEYNRQTEDFKLIHNVMITTDDGESMKTDEIFYEHRKKIMTTGLVEVRTEKSLVNAKKMKVDIDKDIYEFFGDIRVEFTIENDNNEDSGGGDNGE